MRHSVVALIAAVTAAVFTASAAAYVAPGAEILSASVQRLEQGDDSTTQVTLSAGGEYAFFTTRASNFFADNDADPAGQFRSGGIFRRNLASGGLELVASGDLRAESAPDTIITRGALNPSVSADGRFVAFSTGWQLTAADTNSHVDVYVRDMNLPIDAPTAFDLVSARDGGSTPASWLAPTTELDRPGRNAGADVSLARAISADGRLVVFRTSAASDLPARVGTGTPSDQVFVRDRTSKTTKLMTRSKVSGDPTEASLVVSAVISSDGSTVLWIGRAAPSQTDFLNGEGSNATVEHLLLRRIADDEGAPTRRITGISDLDDPLCAAGSTIIDDPARTGPCYGPLAQTEGHVGGLVSQVPQLSADGRQALVITNASPRATQQTGNAGDIFLIDTSAGTSRKAATTELTREALSGVGASEPFETAILSGDGRWVVATTFRTSFPLPALRLLGTPRATASARELYLIDLRERTAERILRSYAADDVNGSASSLPSITTDGSKIAFISAATNLFFGDANGRSDAFIVTRTDPPIAEPPLPEPVDPEPIPEPTEEEAPKPLPLNVTVSKRSRGTVTLSVRAPTAGALAAVARGRLPDSKGRPKGTAKTLVSATKKIAKAGRTPILLKLNSSLRSAVKRAGKLNAQAEVTFEAKDGRSFQRRVTVQFKW